MARFRSLRYILAIAAVCLIVFEIIDHEQHETCEVNLTEYNNGGKVNAWMKSWTEYPNQDISSNNYSYKNIPNKYNQRHKSIFKLLLMMMIMMGMFVTGCESIHHEKHVDLPKGYMQLPNSNKAFKNYKHKMKWEEARDDCISDGGTLAIIETPEEMNFIKRLNPKIRNFLWVGFYHRINEKEWIRADNGLPSTLPSAYNMNNVTEPVCGIMAKGSQIIRTACTDKRPSVCEISYVHRTQPTTQNSSGDKPPEGYQIYPGHNVAYKIDHHKLTWQEASSRCNSDGGNLAIPDTLEKISFIMSMLLYNDPLFVGIYKSAHSNEWLGVDDNSPVTSLPWKSIPEADSRFNCTIITWHGLISSDCNWKFKSVCEIHFPVDDT